ncbi:NACHT and WD repeat domain-containing protein [Nocardia sp. NPDC059229]|uniref:NACHT and WD repeat domain-containing protein n=1 Tax=Nocardia sp. NPDC059229 TaxID=3346778 RepID=UPI00367CA9DD
MVTDEIDVDQIRSPRALFAKRFTELYEAAGNPTLRRVATAAEHRMRAAQGTRPGGASAQRISDWKAGRNVPARFESLLPVVLTLTDLARKTGRPLPRHLSEPKEWQRLWQAATTWNPQEEAEVACPYPGLTPYGHQNRDLFFGRTRATAELTDLVRAATGLVVVIGASGAGKSSLLAAGLIPALTSWETTLLTPGVQPLEALCDALAQPAVEAVPKAAEHDSPLTPEPTTPAPDSHLQAALAPRADGPRRLLVIDQAEELFTTCDSDHDREAFLTLLDTCATRTDDPIAVVLALRADFYAHCLNHLILQNALEHHSFLLGPMRTDELAQAISGPARTVGLELEPGLEELVITELCGAGDHHDRRTYDPGALPLLSHVMAATWQHREGRRLTVSGYRKAGGVVGSVAETAEYAWNELSPGQQTAARGILLGLVTVARDTHDTRRPGHRADLLGRTADSESATAAMELLSRTRLVTLDADTVTLTHEIVLTAWPRLRTWIDEDRVGYLVRQRLETDAAEWAAQERDSALLYRGTRLRNALDHVDPPPVGPLAHEFLTAAAGARRRSRLRSRRTTAVLALLGVGLLIMAFGAYSQTRLVQQQRDDKTFAAVLAQADRLKTVDPSLAAQLYLVARRLRPSDDEMRSRLLQTQTMPLVTSTPGHRNGIWQVTYRPGGAQLASTDYNGTLHLWDAADAQHPRLLAGTVDDAREVAFSADGKLMATVDPSGKAPIRLWDTGTPDAPRQIGQLPGTADKLNRAAFTGDGRTLLTLVPGRLTVWDVSNPAAPVSGSPQQLFPTGRDPYLGRMELAPDGHTLAVEHVIDHRTGSIQLWDINGPGLSATLLSEAVTGVQDLAGLAFRPDSKILAVGSGVGIMRKVGSNDATVTLWDVSDAARPRPVGTPVDTGESTIPALAFAPDGRTLAAAGGHAVTLWNVTEPAYPTALTAQLSLPGITCKFTDVSMPCSGGANALAFAPDGRTLAAGGRDGALLTWSLPPAVLVGGTGWARTPLLDASGQRMVTYSTDGRVTVWDIRDRRSPRRIGEYRTDPDYTGAGLSPDGRTLILSVSTAVHVLDLADPAQIKALPDWPLSPDSLGATGMSHDWRTMASARYGGPVQLWDLSDRTRPVMLGDPIALDVRYAWVAFSADDKTLLVSEHRKANNEFAVTRWDIADPRHPRPLGELLRQADTGDTQARFTPDGNTMVVTAHELLQSWNITDPANPVQLGEPVAAHTLNITSVGFSADAHTMVTASEDGTVQLWDFTHPSDPRRLGGPLSESAKAGWSTTLDSKATLVAAGGQDGGIRLWDLDERHAVDRICAVTATRWTESLWHRYLPQLPYQPPCPAH